MSALLALSDVVVYRALERTFSRVSSGDGRKMAEEEGLARHQAYRRFPVLPGRQAHALNGAWTLLPELAWRWQLPVEAPEWGTVLDHYTRRLLTSRSEHTLDDLAEALTLLGAGHAI